MRVPFLSIVGLFFVSTFAAAQSFTAFPGRTAVGQSSAAVSVSVPIASSGTPATAQILTEGNSSQEFAVQGGTCLGGTSFAATQTCTASVTFAPQAPGLRRGAVVLHAADGTVLGTALLSGVGKGPLAVLAPGRIDTLAGNGAWIFRGDGVAATDAPIFLPTAVVEDAAGNLFISDSSNNRIRRVDAGTGMISTVAGTGIPGYTGDGVPATAAGISTPGGLALDGAGNLYFADTGNHLVRRVDAASGLISTVAGRPGNEGYSGDGGPASAAHLAFPQGLAFDLAGKLLIADTGNNVVRSIDANGNIQTIAGTGTAGYNGDGRLATTAQLNSPWSLAVALDGAVLIADLSNNRVRRLSVAGMISTVAGTGDRGFAGDGDLATSARLNAPAAVALDPAGNLYVADSGNNRVREVNAATGNIATITGNDSEQFAGDGGGANQASLYGPYALHFDAAGNLLIADMFHNRVRRIAAPALSLQFATLRVGKVSPPQPVGLVNDGNDDLHLAQAVLYNSALDTTSSTCGASLSPASACTLGVEFAPQQIGTPVFGTVTLPSDASNTPPQISLQGDVLSVEPTSVALSVNANPSIVGQTVTFYASVTSADTSRSGPVSFLDGTHVLCTQPLDASGNAVCSVATLTLGTHNITAQYAGDANNAASVSSTLHQLVRDQAQIILTTSAPEIVIGNTLTLTVTAASPSSTPGGSVVFYDAGTALGTANLSNGTATLTASQFVAGTHPLSAHYAGDNGNAPADSNGVSLLVDLASTVTTLASANPAATVGASVTMMATVNSTNGPLPTGNVQFTEGLTLLGSATVAPDGTAPLTLSTLVPGTHSIVANYDGDTSNKWSGSAPLIETINQIATTTTIAADHNPVDAGATLNLSASVSAASSAGAVSGSVTFLDAGTTIAVSTLDAQAHATAAVSALTVGTHAITAQFSGNTNYATSTSSSLNEQVQQVTTTTAVLSSATNTLAGKPVTITVTVSSATGTPTGSVSLREGNASVATGVLDAQGTATFSLSTLAVGTHTLTANYSGDARCVASMSAPWQQIVTLAVPVLTLSGPASAVDVGTPATFNARVNSSGVAPGGTLVLHDGGAVLATLPLTANTTYSFTSSTLALGSHTLNITFAGDADNAAAASPALVMVVQVGQTSIVLNGSPSVATVGQPVTLSAWLTSDSPGLSGSVTFLDGSHTLGTAVIAGGSASLTISTLTPGIHNITAAYPGDTNHAGSLSGQVSIQVVQAAASTLASSVNPAVAGANVVFTVKVTGAGSNVPTGNVDLADGFTPLASVALDATGTAVWQSSTLPVGSHTIMANYPGDANFSSTAASLLQTVISASTQVTLVPDANPATFGTPLGLRASITSVVGVATGSVTFSEGSAALGSAALDASGSGSLVLSALAPGTHVIVAHYAGDGRASASVSPPLTVVVKQTAAVVLLSSANPTPTLSTATFSATVTGNGPVTPTGTVTFTDGGALLAAVPLDANGKASYAAASLPAGAHNIQASYAGDGDDFVSVSTVLTETVDKRDTSTTLTATSTNPANPLEVTVIAVVRSGGPVAPTGAVSFVRGSTVLGSSPVDATGVATVTLILNAGTQSITASYAGDAIYNGSDSPVTPITGGPATQFTLTLTPAHITLQSKQRSIITLNLASVKGFTDTLELGCLGLPFAATCTFSNPQVKLAANGTATVQLTVDTGDPLGAGAQASTTHGFAGVLLAFAILPLGMVFARRRPKALVLMVIASAAVLAAAGCSGLQINGTPPGTYSFKVAATGQGSGATQTADVTLAVTQ